MPKECIILQSVLRKTVETTKEVKKVQFGVLFTLDYHDGFSPAYGEIFSQIRDQLYLAEQLNFAEVWFTEQHFNPTDGLCPDPALLLAYAAALTKRVRLGSAVNVAPLHHPLHLAERYSFLDHLSNGRIDIGLGSGFFPSVFEAFNVPFNGRLALRDEVIASLKQSWITASLQKTGQMSTPTLGTVSIPFPLQEPHPPLWISTVAMDRVEAILKAGDSVLIDPMFSWFELSDLSDKIHSLRMSKSYSGQVGLLMYTRMGASYEALPYFDRLLGRFLAKKPQQKGELTDFWNVQQQKGLLLCCMPDEAIERLKVVQAVGIDQVLLCIGFGGTPHNEVVKTLKILASEVIPYLSC